MRSVLLLTRHQRLSVAMALNHSRRAPQTRTRRPTINERQGDRSERPCQPGRGFPRMRDNATGSGPPDRSAQGTTCSSRSISGVPGADVPSRRGAFRFLEALLVRLHRRVLVLTFLDPREYRLFGINEYAHRWSRSPQLPSHSVDDRETQRLRRAGGHGCTGFFELL